MKYQYNEHNSLYEISEYINQTYNQHYAGKRTQTLDAIIDAGHGEGFCLGNIIKYATRYGKKGGKNKTDLFKMIHYAIILMSLEDNQDTNEETPNLTVEAAGTDITRRSVLLQ